MAANKQVELSHSSKGKRDITTVNCERQILKDLTFVIFTIAIKQEESSTNNYYHAINI
jgi:hypothetical protein